MWCFSIICFVYLQSFSSVDGSKRSKHSKNSKNFHSSELLSANIIIKHTFLSVDSLSSFSTTYFWPANCPIRDTNTTSKSRRLKAERQKAPLWKMKPYDISFMNSSIVKIAVKKMSKLLRIYKLIIKYSTSDLYMLKYLRHFYLF